MCIRFLVPVLLLPLMLGACSEAPDSAPTPGAETTSQAPPQTASAREIAWFEGSLDEAFTAAKAGDKPLFVYWGAQWCPYCKYLQATIFVRDEFISISRQFIAVDMSNGDSETIRQSDRFNIAGLPTVILFAPDGTELTRIPGGMDMEQYASVLELTLNTLRPVAEVLAAARTGATLADDDWRLLANYSWRSDRARMLEEEDPAALLAQLAADCPVRLDLACSRLRLAATRFWLSAEEESRDSAIGAENLKAFVEILGNPALRPANMITLADLGSDVVTELASGEQQAGLRADLMNYLQAAAGNENLGLLQQTTILSGWAGVATALLEEDQSPPAKLVDWGRNTADGMMQALTPYQVHAGINQLWFVYYQLGLEQDARKALAKGIDESQSPFYFMSGMAYLEREAGNNQAALEWSRKAWEAAGEPMDRARWGSGYIRRLLDLAPEQSEEVQRAVSLWLSELAAQPYGIEVYANSLERLNTRLGEWSEEDPARGEVVAGLRSELAGHCAQCQPESPVAACESVM
ncbi:DUF255 domain-containing protein [Seongchinamella sediminis]|uniref:DUF255 domain-containing protein n=1 Tax=Seongchinamella sediminis TaxID=2283635 RepID=A0A3L7DXW8_9GAMM|nr:thioredoxin family protein [Seongchinamella sediminis]RLQ20682.1 DUF255 domain-containing protein [Seongchinamella sediminis]